MRDLSSNWTNDYSSEGGGGMSAAPIYLGLMALSGVYLIKDSIHFLFLCSGSDSVTQKDEIE